MRRSQYLTGLLLALLLTIGMVALAQTSSEGDEVPQVAFTIESEIGRALPRSIVYDPAQERMAVIDAYNRLLIIDATTYETQHVLYERGQYNDILFSNDGQYLALAIESRIELYDAATGEIVADLVDLGQAIRIQGPLSFSRDDDLLVFRGIYPAPRSIRVRENQTVEVPWIWNLPAARNEAESTFPNGAEAWQFFDYRNGFELGPENRIVAALPGRLQVVDAYTLDAVFDIPTDRYEQDPLTMWFSLRDKQVYVRPVETNSLLQVDTASGVLTELPLDRWLTQSDLELLGGLEFGSQARVIGPANNRREVDLLEVFLGQNYTRDSFTYRFRPLTVTLIDLIIPPASTSENIAALLYVFDEQRLEGRFVISRQSSVEQMVLGNDDNRLMMRQNFGDEFIVQYDLNTGEVINNFIPSLRAIGRYSRLTKNRVLAYDEAGDVIISDFQRVRSDTPREVLAEDLRYSRRFDRFYWSGDNTQIITLAGTEWRVWSVTTGEVERREVLNLRGSIQATSSDGYRFLSNYGDGVETVDMRTGARNSVDFVTFRGRGIAQVLPNSTWTDFLVIYDANPFGQYFPGNEVAMYNIDDGLQWFIAGDDLPPTSARRYGWVDDESVYIYGEGSRTDQSVRIYDLDYDPSGLPACVVEAFPDQLDLFNDLWEQLNYYLWPDELSFLTVRICTDLPDTAEGVQQLLLPTNTPQFISPTPPPIANVPVCLLTRYPDDTEAYAEIWRTTTEGLNVVEKAEIERLLCEGIGDFEYNPNQGSDFVQEMMIINAATGERSTGAFEEQEIIRRPIYPLQELFEETEDRPLGTAILSPNEQFIAASSLPGELIIYRILVSYQGLLDNITATADERLREQNLIGVFASPTPTYNIVGTPRPTLTPTLTPTAIPRPEERVDQPQFGEVVDLCPAETLFSIANPPPGYDPPGQLVGPASGDFLWTINPRTGARGPDETVLQCGEVQCNFSPDRAWILATSLDLIYVVRPDNSDQRVLFDFEESEYIPASINWTGPRTLEYEVFIDVVENGRTVQKRAIQRDILGVFPDPAPWIPEISINQLPTEIISWQPSGPWLVARTPFSTGVNTGYKYYLYNRDTGDYRYFARLGDFPTESLSVSWHPLGDRLFYYYPPPRNSNPVWYQVDLATGDDRLLQTLPGGTWSNDGRYRAYQTGRRTQPIAVWDSQTGLTRTYCLPQTGARTYSGSFNWSPDSRYVALQAPLPEDERDPGIGQHTMILDIETGEIVDVTTGIGNLTMWMRLPGQYTEDE